jgi:hypothetical protein
MHRISMDQLRQMTSFNINNMLTHSDYVSIMAILISLVTKALLMELVFLKMLAVQFMSAQHFSQGVSIVLIDANDPYNKTKHNHSEDHQQGIIKVCHRWMYRCRERDRTFQLLPASAYPLLLKQALLYYLSTVLMASPTSWPALALKSKPSSCAIVCASCLW